jgi:hypothetical protein
MLFTVAGQGGNCRSCWWIAAEGPITKHTPDDFNTFLNTQKIGDGTTTVVLNSDGGSLIGGLELGEMIRAHSLSTRVGRTVPDSFAQETVPGECFSACAYAFLGGRLRTAKAGELGFHQFHTPPGNAGSDEESTQRVVGLLIDYVRKMSVDAALLTYAAAADPSDLFVPDDRTMLRLGVTNAVGSVVFSGWKIVPWGSGAVVSGFVPATGTGEEDQDDDQTIRFYCRTDVPGAIFMTATWQWAVPRPQDAAWHNEVMHTEVQGSSVTIGDRVIRSSVGYDSIVDAHVDSSHRYFLTYRLTAGELAAAVKAGRLHISVDGPHILGYYGFRFDPPMAGLGAAMRVAANSCIS